MQLLEVKKYVDFNVKNVMSIKGKYGFRVVLIYADNTEVPHQHSGFLTKKEAKKERDKVIGELSNGSYVVKMNIPYKKFLREWLEYRKEDFTDSTYKTFRNSIEKHIIPELGNIKLDMLNKGHFQKFYEKIAKESESNYDMAKSVICTSMKFARNNNLVSQNPLLGVKTPKCIKKKKGRVLHINTQKTLNVEQLKILIRAAKETPIYLQVLFAGLMGLRKSEINGLKFTDVDFVNRKLKVERQLGIKPNTKKEEFEPKTYTKQEIKVKTRSSNRELDIPDLVFEAILEQKEKYEKNKRRRKNDKSNPFRDLGYICCSSYGRSRSKGYVFQHFKKLLKDNNLPDIRWHDLRASYATILLKEGYNLKAISKKLGHSKQIITADVYIDKKEIVRDCLDKLVPFIEEVFPKQEDVYLKDYTEETTNIIVDINRLYIELIKSVTELNDYTEESEDAVNILEWYWATI